MPDTELFPPAETSRTGRKKHSGVNSWYPELEYDVVPSIEDKIIISNSQESIPESESLSDESTTAHVQTKEKVQAATFDQEGFHQQLKEISDETEIQLSEMYPGRDFQVTYIGHQGRDLGTQEQYLASGDTKTSISLHQFGAAADYSITVDGITQDGKTPASNKWYRTLGYVARNRGLIWGIPNDYGHVGKTRYVSDFIEEFPEQAYNVHFKEWHEKRTDNPSSKFKATMEAGDAAFGITNPDRVYKEHGDRTPDEYAYTIPSSEDEDLLVAEVPQTALDSLQIIEQAQVLESPADKLWNLLE